MPRDLDEIPEQELETELAKRRQARLAGRCDYCQRERDEPPCKFPERHSRDKGIIVESKTKCSECGPRTRANCPKCQGTGVTFDDLAVVFESNLHAIFGERVSEISANLRAKLRQLWDVARSGAQRALTRPEALTIEKINQTVLAMRDLMTPQQLDAVGSFWFNGGVHDEIVIDPASQSFPGDRVSALQQTLSLLGQKEPPRPQDPAMEYAVSLQRPPNQDESLLRIMKEREMRSRGRLRVGAEVDIQALLNEASSKDE